MSNKKIIIEKIERINQILKELQYNEIEQFISIQRNQALILKKLDRLQEYNEIDDMNNSIIYRKIEQIKKNMR